MPSSSTNSANAINQFVETYSRVLPLSIRTGQEPIIVAPHQHSSTSLNVNSSSSTSFGRPNNQNSSSSPSSTTIANVRVTLNYPTSSTSITSSSYRQIRLCLTNDSDPLFYFYLLITERDYPTLKQNQGLLVDFINFPSQLISLLDKCCDDKFILVLKCSPATNLGSPRDSNYSTILDIVESNPFKYLSHLSLGISPGSDGEVKKYLSELTVQLKEENETLHTKFQHLHSSLESELSKGKYELERKNEEIAHLREEMYKESAQALEKHMRELNQERDKLTQFQNDLTRKSAQEKNEIEQKFRQIISTLESQNSTHETEKYKLDQAVLSTEVKLRDAEASLKIADDDIRQLTHDLQTLRKNNTKLDSDYHEKQRVVGNAVSKLGTCESELKEKSNFITRQQDLISSLGDKCRNYEERNVELVRKLDSTKSQLKSSTSDLTKANEIIKKMQDEGRRVGKQLKTQANLLQAKDGELNEKCRYLEESSKKLDDITSKYETNENELKECRIQAEELKRTVETQLDTLASKETMISWLNKQLNQSQGLTSLNHFRQTLAASSSNIQQNASLNDSSRLKSQTHDPLTENSINNNPTSTVPSWMNLYSNNTGRTLTNNGLGLFTNSNLGNLTMPNANSTVNTTTNYHSTSLQHDSNKVGTCEPAENVHDEQAQKTSSKPGGTAVRKVTRPPTWAKPNKKVTLDVGAHPNWRH